MSVHQIANSNFKHLQGLVKEFMAAYPMANVTEETVAVYVLDLKELEFDDLSIALKQLRHTKQYLPTIAEIYQAVAELQAKRQRQSIEVLQVGEREARNAPGEPMPEEFKRQLNEFLGKSRMSAEPEKIKLRSVG
jgi:N12 class adenine-specific DNA methylase